MRQVCSNCKWSKQEMPFADFFCSNPESDCYGCENMYDTTCDCYEEDDEQ